jgi:type II secretory pathway pseudopilin PulG
MKFGTLRNNNSVAQTSKSAVSRISKSASLEFSNRCRFGNRRYDAFTLVEVLAALMFMAIVIPVALEALHVASLTGEIAARKAVAARVAENILNESIVTTNWNQSVQNGTIMENGKEFRWTLKNELWTEDTMQLLTAEVTFAAQGQDYSVKMSTLANPQ